MNPCENSAGALPVTSVAFSGAVIWLTGLSGSGKSTVASELEKIIRRSNRRACVLDGDDLRRGLNSDLGFSPADRAENIRRVAEVAKLMARTGLVVIVALISPFQDDRQKARAIAAASRVNFIEVFLDCPLAICERRDPKGLYRKARAGEIPAFTGIDSPYEAPQNPEIVLRTGTELPSDSIAKLIAGIRHRLGFDESEHSAEHDKVLPAAKSNPH